MGCGEAWENCIKRIPSNNDRFGSVPSTVMACGGLAEALKRWFADGQSNWVILDRDAKAR